MVTWSREGYMEHLLKRGQHNDGRKIAPNAVKKESDLHRQIQEYCDSQWPRWKTIHARMDCESTIEKGAHDFTIFMPGGRVLCIECKSKTGKLEPDQIAWAKEMSMLGHRVYECRSMDEFHRIVNDADIP